MPAASNMSCAVRNCSRASRRQPSRRSHSPYSRRARASDDRSRVWLNRPIASWYRASAASPSAASLIAEADAVCEVTGAWIPPYAALMLAAYRGREAEATQLIRATIDQATAAGQ